MQTNTLLLMIDKAGAETDRARRHLAHVIRLLEQGRSHLNLLKGYVREYQQRQQITPGCPVDVAANDNQARFLSRLDDAVSVQEGEVANRTLAQDEATAMVTHCLKKQKSLETLLARQQQAKALRLHRLEQKATDEFSQQVSARRLADASLVHGDILPW
jgi:flagellar export protein FliJ